MGSRLTISSTSVPVTEDLLNSPDVQAAQPCTGDRHAPLVTVRDLLLLLYLYPFQLVLKFFPRGVLYLIGGAVQQMLEMVYRGWRKRVEGRMLALAGSAITPEQAPRLARELVRGSIFRLIDDLVINRPQFLKETRCAISGLAHLDSAQSDGRGVLLITGHFYANRLARRYLAAQGYPILIVRLRNAPSSLAGRLTGPLVQKRLMKHLDRVIRDEVYVDDPGCTLKILQRLRSGGLVAITVDGWWGGRTIQSTLFGIRRRFSSGMLDIVRLSGCAVVPMRCFGRSSDLRIAFGAPLAILKTSTRDEFVSANLPVFISVLETQIRENPAEWTLWGDI